MKIQSTLNRYKKELELQNFTIEVMHTPGHTKGGICLYQPDEKILFYLSKRKIKNSLR